MKKTILGLLFIGLIQLAYGQDRIITSKLDTINCRITSLSDQSIQFEINVKDIVTTGTIKKNEVHTLQLSDKTTQLLLNTTNNTEQKKENKKVEITDQTERLNKKSKFMIQVMSGYGYLIGSTTASRNRLVSYGLDLETANRYYEKYLHTLLSGISFQYTVFENKSVGLSVGATYLNTYNSSNVTGKYDVQDGLHYQYGTYSEDIFTNLYALSLRLTFFPDRKRNTILYFESNDGILTYRNKMRLVSSPFLITAKTLGSFDKIGFGFKLSNPLWLDINTGFTGGFIKKYELTSSTSSQTFILDINQKESLLKIFVSIGISYKF